MIAYQWNYFVDTNKLLKVCPSAGIVETLTEKYAILLGKLTNEGRVESIKLAP